MNTKRLEYFMVIAETLNITKAAEKLHISQPPLTKQLKLLEEELGVMLFTRTTRNLTLTEEGKRLRERADQIIELMQTTENELLNLSNQSNEITLGFVASASSILLPQKLRAFNQKYPEIKFHLREGNTPEILDYLDHGLIDIGLVRTPFNGEKYYIEYLDLEPMVAVYNPNFFDLNSHISLDQLKDYPLILDKRFMGLIRDTAQRNGFEPSIVCKGEDSRSILLWAEAGLGITLLPLSGHHFIRNNQLVYSTVDSKALETRIAIASLKNKENLIHQFMEYLKNT